MKPTLYPKSNDICIQLATGKYVDIVFNYRHRYRLSIAGHFIGYFRTKRIAKKTYRKFSEIAILDLCNKSKSNF